MSFGKKISPHKEWVDEAFKYAADQKMCCWYKRRAMTTRIWIQIPSFRMIPFQMDGSSTDADNVINVGASGL
jgi:cell wall-associated protease